MNTSKSAAAFLSLTLAAASVHAIGFTVDVANGSFEDQFVSGNFNTYGQGSSSLTGWSVTRGSVDHIGGYWQAADGRQSLDLDGNSPATIEQTLNISSAGSVTILFSLAGNPDYGSLKSLQIDLFGNGQVFNFDSTGHDRWNMGWLDESATFDIPAAGNYTLKFTSLDAGGYYGPALDNVRAVGETIAPSNIRSSSVADSSATAPMFAASLGALAFLRRKLA